MRRRARRRQRGQGTVELILTLFAFFTIFFMYVQLAISFAVGNYIQYATFMASRALLSGGKSKDAQIRAGTLVLNAMLIRNGKDRFGAFAKGDGDGDPPGAFVGVSPRVRLASTDARETAWEQGATYRFGIKMYMLPIAPGAKRGAQNKVTLESQSWLGREPTTEECVKNLQTRPGMINLQGVKPLFDNGC
jgi:hypothetical protein